MIFVTWEYWVKLIKNEEHQWVSSSCPLSSSDVIQVPLAERRAAFCLIQQEVYNNNLTHLKIHDKLRSTVRRHSNRFGFSSIGTCWLLAERARCVCVRHDGRMRDGGHQHHHVYTCWSAVLISYWIVTASYSNTHSCHQHEQVHLQLISTLLSLFTDFTLLLMMLHYLFHPIKDKRQFKPFLYEIQDFEGLHLTFWNIILSKYFLEAAGLLDIISESNVQPDSVCGFKASSYHHLSAPPLTLLSHLTLFHSIFSTPASENVTETL